MILQIQCDWCGRIFERKKGQEKERNYCSRSCLGQANAERFKLASLKICDNCGQQFEYRGRHKKRNEHFFCCPECGFVFKEKQVLVACDWCGKTISKKRSEMARNNHNFCSRGCYIDFINFSNAGAPNQKVAGKILYRKLAEMKIGRPLEPDEEVHHIDGNHLNNSPENLDVVAKSEHSKIHAGQKARDEHGRFTRQE